MDTRSAHLPVTWPRRLAWTLAVCTFGLLLVGGLVTTYRVGMAVPDWPTTFGFGMFSYPLDQMLENWGVTVEHSHRMFASLVGLLTIAMVIACAAHGGRAALRVACLAIGLEVAAVGVVASSGGIESPWVAGLTGAMALLLLASLSFGRERGLRTVAVLAHLAVIGQGVLGGSRVLENSQHLAFLHGAAAQVVYALVAALWIVTSPRWRAPHAREAEPGLLPLAFFATAMVFAQIVVGAWLRHTGGNGAMSAHVLLAIGVAIAVIAVVRALGAERGPLEPVRRWLRVMLWTQVALGVVATAAIFGLGEGFAGAVTVTEAVAATLHVGVAALLFAGSLASVLWALRLRRPAHASAAAPTAKLEVGAA